MAPTDLLERPTDRTAAQDRNSVAILFDKLNQVHADTFSVYLKTKNLHGHVSGPHFRDYHLMLDEQASDVLATVDPLAERVRTLGGATIRSIGQVARLRTADNEDEDVAPDAMPGELMADTKALITSKHQAHKLCDELWGVATVSLLEGVNDAAEKRA